MVTYFAVSGREVQPGGFVACILWARERINTDPTPVKIIRARAGEREGRVVAEVTPEGERTIADGRRVLLSKVRKASSP
jgi:hypothetical protein